MNDDAKLKENAPSRPGRTIALLVDCFAQRESGLFGEGSEGLFLLRLAGLLASGSGGRVLLLSVVAVPEEHSISAFSTTAQALRRELETLAVSALASPETVGAGLGDIPVTRSQAQTMIAPVVRVAPEHDLAGEVRRLLTEEQDLLLLLPLRRSTSDVCPWVRKALRSPLPCDVGWVRPPLPSYRPASATAPFQTGMRILIPARGGPQAQLALDLSSDLHLALQAQVTLLHVLQAMPESQRATEEAPFAELLGQMGQSQAGGMPQRAFTSGDDPVKSISEAAAQYDLLIMGAGGEAAADVGRFTQRVARDSPPALLAIKTRVPVGPAILAARRRARPHALAPEMLSLIVDKWFAENTFHADEFSDLNRLVDIKKQRGVTISVGLPALNEEATIGGVVRVLKKALMDDVPLVDEIVVIDSDSTDRTREIATGLGVPVYIHQQVLPEAGEPVPGKGEALWKSLHVLKGD
ncbi:MAG TPA: universal stress protein, partial [Chloroflexia bacterium]|nr:universal stress protein [Chloroflexia bacterium]